MFKPNFGWKVSLETDKGVVGLLCCWSGDGFFIGYPKELKINDHIIMNALDMQKSSPVANVRFGTRKWAEFFSERLEQGGRVWIKHVECYSEAFDFSYIQDKKCEDIWLGDSFSNTIATYPFTFFNVDEPDAPNSAKEVIQAYQERFLRLVLLIAQQLGKVNAVNIKVPDLYKPEILKNNELELEYITLTNKLSKYLDRTSIYTRKANTEIILRDGAGFGDWDCVVRISVEDLTYEKLIEILSMYLEKV